MIALASTCLVFSLYNFVQSWIPSKYRKILRRHPCLNKRLHTSFVRFWTSRKKQPSAHPILRPIKGTHNAHNFMSPFFCNQRSNCGNLLFIIPSGKLFYRPNKWNHFGINDIAGIVVWMHKIKRISLADRNANPRSPAPLINLTPHLVSSATLSFVSFHSMFISMCFIMTHICFELRAREPCSMSWFLTI